MSELLPPTFSLSQPHVVNIDHSEKARMIGSRINTMKRSSFGSLAVALMLRKAPMWQR